MNENDSISCSGTLQKEVFEQFRRWRFMRTPFSTGYFITEDFKCNSCYEGCIDYYNGESDICVYDPYMCIVYEKSGCIRKSSDGETCLYCNDGHTLIDGKCYYYEAISGFDGVDYVCVQYSDRAAIIFNTGNYTTLIYDPIDGVCANPFIPETSSENSDSSENTEGSEEKESENEANNEEDSSYSLVITAIIFFIALFV